MRMFGEQKMPAKSLDPVVRLAEKIHFFFMYFLPMMRLLSAGHMPAVLGRLALVEDRGIISAVKIDVCFDKEMIGEEPPSVPEQYFQDVLTFRAPAPTERPRLKHGGKTEANCLQHYDEQTEKRCSHKFKDLRRKTSQATNK